jgi:hypothetical protein
MEIGSAVSSGTPGQGNHTTPTIPVSARHLCKTGLLRNIIGYEENSHKAVEIVRVDVMRYVLIDDKYMQRTRYAISVPEWISIIPQ